MQPPPPSGAHPLPQPQNWSMRLLLIGVSTAFAWILQPFFGAIIWAITIALVFSPLFRWMLSRLRHQRTVAALVTLLVALVIVVLPLAIVTTLVAIEASGGYARIVSGDWRPSRYFYAWLAMLPGWALAALEQIGLPDLKALQQRFDIGLAQGIHWLASNALNIGQNTLEFIVSLVITLYLAFFLIRDGERMVLDFRHVIPLLPSHEELLTEKFTTVIRATVKGSLLVAFLQGGLGGLAFWFLGVAEPLLWGVLMTFLSLLPVLGSALVWLPMVLYFLATGSTWQGLALLVFGALVIGLLDNVLRPILVGQDTRMPGYLVMMATLGGIKMFGLNGLVLGPVIAAMFVAVWHIYSVSRNATASQQA